MVLLDGVPNAEADQAFHMGDLFERRPFEYQLRFSWGDVGVTPAAMAEYELEPPETNLRVAHVLPDRFPKVRMLVVGSEEFYYSPGSTFEESHLSLTAASEERVKVLATLGLSHLGYHPDNQPQLRRIIFEAKPDLVASQVFSPGEREMFVRRLANIGSNAVRGAYQALAEKDLTGVHSIARDTKDALVTSAGSVAATMSAVGRLSPAVGVIGGGVAVANLIQSMGKRGRLNKEQMYRRVQITQNAEQMRGIIHDDLYGAFMTK